MHTGRKYTKLNKCEVYFQDITNLDMYIERGEKEKHIIIK